MIYNFPPHISGDTWDGINSIKLVSNGSPIDLTDCRLDIHLRLDKNLASPIVYEFSSDYNNIVSYFPTEGIITIPAQQIDIPAGTYHYDLQVTFPNSVVKTYLKGKWEILQNITRTRRQKIHLPTITLPVPVITPTPTIGVTPTPTPTPTITRTPTPTPRCGCKPTITPTPTPVVEENLIITINGEYIITIADDEYIEKLS